MLPTVFVPTSVLINPIIKTPKNIYNNKYQKKKQKPFVERNGDWICKKCKNLNFAFRQECNRCKLHKKEAIEEVKKEEIDKKNIFEKFENKNNLNINGQQNINRRIKFRFTKYNYNA